MDTSYILSFCMLLADVDSFSAGPHDIHHQSGGGQTDGIEQTGTALSVVEERSS